MPPLLRPSISVGLCLRWAGAGDTLERSWTSHHPVVALASVLALAATLLTPTAALAEEDEERNAYIAVKGGLYFPTEYNPFVEVGQPAQKWPTKYEIDGALGVYWVSLGCSSAPVT